MTGSPNTTSRTGTRCEIAFPEAGVRHIDFLWPQCIDDVLGAQIIDLMRHTTASAPIIGFSEEISDAQAHAYLHELRANLQANKCRLLAIVANDDRLVGLCTLRRNLNPNNRHITDLAKGMIREELRGGAVLPAAFYEIALQCEADGVDLLTLDVRADTPAHRAWLRFGFETYGVLPDYARAGGATHAGHYMMQRVGRLKARAMSALSARSPSSAAAEAVPG